MAAMRHLRVALAALFLIWPPLTGALAQAAGVSLAHHHCENDWHAHGDAQVPAGDADHGAGAVNLDPVTCDDCGSLSVALPPFTIDLAPRLAFAFGESAAPAARPHHARTGFRPPIV
jgi:hypothetical protein